MPMSYENTSDKLRQLLEEHRRASDDRADADMRVRDATGELLRYCMDNGLQQALSLKLGTLRNITRREVITEAKIKTKTTL